MPPLTEGRTPGDFVLFDEPQYSRDVVTVGAGADLEPGTVLGKVTADGTYVRSVRTATDGSENAVAVLRTEALAASAAVSAVIQARHTSCRRFGLLFDDSYSTEAYRDAACESLKGAGILAR